MFQDKDETPKEKSTKKEDKTRQAKNDRPLRDKSEKKRKSDPKEAKKVAKPTEIFTEIVTQTGEVIPFLKGFYWMQIAERASSSQ